MAEGGEVRTLIADARRATAVLWPETTSPRSKDDSADGSRGRRRACVSAGANRNAAAHRLDVY